MKHDILSIPATSHEPKIKNLRTAAARGRHYPLVPEPARARLEPLSALKEALDADHPLLAQVEGALEAVHLLVVPLDDDVRHHLVVRRHNLDLEDVRPLGVVEVVLARDGRDEGRRVPPAAQPVPLAEHRLLEDGQHEGERAERDEDTKGQKGGPAGERRLHALKDNDVAAVLHLVVVSLEEGELAGEL